MMRITVLYHDGTTSTFVGENFQHGDRALVLTTDKGGIIGIPEKQVKAYEVEKVEDTESSSQGVVDSSVQEEGGEEQEEVDTETEEA